MGTSNIAKVDLSDFSLSWIRGVGSGPGTSAWPATASTSTRHSTVRATSPRSTPRRQGRRQGLHRVRAAEHGDRAGRQIAVRGQLQLEHDEPGAHERHEGHPQRGHQLTAHRDHLRRADQERLALLLHRQHHDLQAECERGAATRRAADRLSRWRTMAHPLAGPGEDDIGPAAREDAALHNARDGESSTSSRSGSLRSRPPTSRIASPSSAMNPGRAAGCRRVRARARPQAAPPSAAPRAGRAAGLPRHSRRRAAPPVCSRRRCRRRARRRSQRFLTSERPSRAFDQAELRVDLVGPVDVQRQRRGLVEPDDADAGRA